MLPQQRNRCTDCKSAQQCTTRGQLLPRPQVASGSVQQCGRTAADRQTDTQTDTQTRVITIHFASSTTHAKCNETVMLNCTHNLKKKKITRTPPLSRPHWYRKPPVEAVLVVAYLQSPIQICFPFNDHAQPATPTSVTDTLMNSLRVSIVQTRLVC